jgi:PAS domain-containing protein
VCAAYEKEYVRRDGRRVPVFLAVTILAGTSGEIAAFVLDITERKAGEARLTEHRALQQSVVENAGATVFTVDREYRYTTFNSRHAATMKALYGVDIEIGKSIFDFQPSTEQHVRAKANLRC